MGEGMRTGHDGRSWLDLEMYLKFVQMLHRHLPLGTERRGGNKK